MSENRSEKAISSTLKRINAKIYTTINTPIGEKPKHLTILEIPQIIEDIYKMGDAYVTFVAEELQKLYRPSNDAPEVLLKRSQEVIEAYAKQVEAMCDLYLEILDTYVEAPFERAQVFTLSMVNHLLGSAFEFNDQMIYAFSESIYGAKVSLGIDLESHMKRFTAWFEQTKEQTSKLVNPKVEGQFSLHP